MRMQCGWLLLSSLLSLEINWIGYKLKEIFVLWKEHFVCEPMNEGEEVTKAEMKCWTACLNAI